MKPARTLALALALFGGCHEPAIVEIEECQQDARRLPLSDELVAFLPTIGRAQVIESTEELIKNGIVSLAGQPQYTLPAEPTWLEDPFDDLTWVYEYQSLFFVMDALLAYQETQAPTYLDVAERQVDRWLATHLDPRFRANWSDHVTANRTRILLWAWERLRARDPDSDTVDGLCRMLALHGTHLANDDEYTANHNHGFFQDEALLSLAAAFEQHPSQASWLELARERLAEQVDFAVTSEGVHREHSFSYHAGMQARFAELSQLLEHLDVSLPIDIDEVVEEMWDFITYAVLPTGLAPLVGDSSAFMGSASSLGITGAALYSLSAGASGLAPSEVDRVFFESGYAFFRDKWHPAESFDETIYVGFIAAVFSRAHKHCDDLSLILYGYGENWLTDSGYWGYNPEDPFRVFSISPAGHNVVEVDHESYFESYPATRSVNAGIKLLTKFELGATTSTIAGEHRFNPGVLYRREVVYNRPATLSVTDELVAEDGHDHDYALYWHIAADKTVTATTPLDFLVQSNDPGGPSMELSVRGASAVSCEVLVGEDAPYQGWYFPSFMEATPAPVIACTQRAKNTAFTTAIVLQPAESLAATIVPSAPQERGK